MGSGVFVCVCKGAVQRVRTMQRSVCLPANKTWTATAVLLGHTASRRRLNKHSQMFPLPFCNMKPQQVGLGREGAAHAQENVPIS